MENEQTIEQYVAENQPASKKKYKDTAERVKDIFLEITFPYSIT